MLAYTNGFRSRYSQQFNAADPDLRLNVVEKPPLIVFTYLFAAVYRLALAAMLVGSLASAQRVHR